jgi:hypothetical protein
VNIARREMPQALEVITVRLDATHTPVSYDPSFYPEAGRSGWWSYKLKRHGLNTTVRIFSYRFLSLNDQL